MSNFIDKMGITAGNEMGIQNNNHSDQTEAYSPLKAIATYKKVLQILDGKIPLPELVEIFPTNFCNFSCPHCLYKKEHGNKNQYMDLRTFEYLLEELNQHGIDTLELSGGGEPLMHPQIIEVFDMIISNKFRVGIITNGYRFIDDEDLIKKANMCCDWIRFSVDGFSNNTYKKIHGKEEINYVSLKKVIRKFGKSSESRPYIGIKMLVSKLNVHELDLAIDEALEIRPDYLQFKLLGTHRLELRDKQKYEETRARIATSYEDLAVSIDFSPSYCGEKKYGKCLLNALHPVINWDGAIYMCAFFPHRKKKHSIGNIHDGGFFNHWGSSKHEEKIKNIDIKQCVPNCPISRYNPVVDFIKNNHAHFKYI